MRTFAQKQNQPQKPVSSSLALSNTATRGLHHPADRILHLQRTMGNQAMLRLLQTQAEEHKAGLTVAASPRLGHDFSRIPIHPPASAALQTKLVINTPGDRYEQEADHVAAQVMRMSEPGAAVSPTSSSGAGVQRACAYGGTCDDCKGKHVEDEHAHVQMKATGPAGTGGMEAPPIVHDVLRSPGQPLDAATRAFMEPRFGQDFSGVRVHTDEQATESASAVQARAYTVGQDVIFGAGQYAPATETGRRLFSHELTHVVQQGGSPGSGAQLQRQPAPQTDDPKRKAKKEHEDQQRNVATLLDEARGWKKDKDFDKFAAGSKLYLNTPGLPCVWAAVRSLA